MQIMALNTAFFHCIWNPSALVVPVPEKVYEFFPKRSSFFSLFPTILHSPY